MEKEKELTEMTLPELAKKVKEMQDAQVKLVSERDAEIKKLTEEKEKLALEKEALEKQSIQKVLGINLGKNGTADSDSESDEEEAVEFHFE